MRQETEAMGEATERAETGRPEPHHRLTPYEALGGAPVIAQIVGRFYDLMESDPSYAELRAIHAEDLEPMRASLAGFLQGWSGGPREWFEARPGACMMSLHAPIRVTRELAGQWSEAMSRAIAAQPGLDPALANEMIETLVRMAMGMARG
jgi:hemoglobin